MKSDLISILAIVFLTFATQTIVSVLVPLAATEIGLGPSAVGLLVAIPLGVSVVVDVPFAKASDIYGRRIALISGSVVGTTAACVLAVDSTTVGLAVGSLLVGLSLSLLIGPALAFVTELASPNNHARIQGYNGALQGLSALFGALAIGALILSVGVTAGFISVAGLMLAVAVLAVRTQERPRQRLRSAPHLGISSVTVAYARAFHMLRNQPAMVIAATAASLNTLVVLVVGNAFVPIYLVTSGNFSGADAGAFLAVRSVFAALTSLTFGNVVSRTGMIPLVVGSNILGVIGIGLVPLLVATPLLAGAFVVQGLGMAFGPATTNLLVASATGETERALGFSATTLAARATGMALPIVLGVSASLAGIGALFVVAEVIGFSMVALVVMIARKAARCGNPISLT